MKRSLLALLVCAGGAVTAAAHHPDRQNETVRPRGDLIGPLGNRFGPSYRRAYNRPTYLGGKIAYKIAPSSQEAMAWHAAEHECAYDCNHPRQVKTYFNAKPWEMLPTGPRKPMLANDSAFSGLVPPKPTPEDSIGRVAETGSQSAPQRRTTAIHVTPFAKPVSFDDSLIETDRLSTSAAAADEMARAKPAVRIATAPVLLDD